jgi:hypothetical protein
MHTHIQFEKLKNMPLEQARVALKRSIDLELKMPGLVMDMFQRNPATLQAVVKAVKDGDLSKIPSEQHRKAFLAQKYATASSNPILTALDAQFAAFFHSNMPDVDIGWMQLFDLVDLRNSPHDHFDIDDTNAGITYTQIKPGAQIKKRTNISEAKLSVAYLTFGAGLGILDDWITKQMYWKIDEVIAEFRANWYDTMAQQHYGLFTAIGTGINQNFTVDDATTFNASAAVLIRNLRTMGYGVGQNTNFKIVCAPEKAGRLARMLTAQQGSQLVAFGTLKEPIAYTVDSLISSVWVPASDLGYYLMVPGKKIKRGLWQDLSVEQQRDASARATDWFASGQFNGAIGDTNQVVRVKYA